MRTSQVTIGLLALLLGTSGLAHPALAAEPRVVCPICSRANDQASAYPSKAATTLLRGSANALLGWTELLRQPAKEARAGGNVVIGIGKGVQQSVLRTVVGVGELLTFWTPKVQGDYVHLAADCPICMGQQAPP
jgi:putative exosortase-associated protein (TIGR04073 family)